MAGAGRTDTAYQRLLVSTKAPDMAVFTFDATKKFATFTPALAKSMPHVAEVGQVVSYPVLQPSDVSIIAPTDDTIGERFWTRKLIDGRLPDQSRADEVTVSFMVAQSHHLGVGDELRVDLQSADQTATSGDPANQWVSMLPQPSSTPERNREQHGVGDTGLRPAAPDRGVLPRHGHAFRSRSGRRTGGPGGGDQTGVGTPHRRLPLRHPGREHGTVDPPAVGRPLGSRRSAEHPGVLVLGQLLARQSFLEAVEYRELHALGMTSGQLWMVGIARVVFMGVIATVLSVAIATATSPLFPFGLAGDAEPHPGFAFDAVTLGIGALLTFGAVFACGAWSTWRLARPAALAPRSARRRRQPSRIMAASRASGAPVTATTGTPASLLLSRAFTSAP